MCLEFILASQPLSANIEEKSLFFACITHSPVASSLVALCTFFKEAFAVYAIFLMVDIDTWRLVWIYTVKRLPIVLSLIGRTRDCVVITHAHVYDRSMTTKEERASNIKNEMSSPSSLQEQKQMHARPH
jgi:hypothetical protein